MFTGIVTAMGKVTELSPHNGVLRLGITTDASHLAHLQKGASIAISGVCLTVVDFNQTTVWFDVIGETLQKTTLDELELGKHLNIERSARIGDEIGGHLLSGHIFGTAKIASIERQGANCKMLFSCPPAWTKYLLPKGYVALDGASLTLVDVDHNQGTFSIHFIPETLKKTTFGTKVKGDRVNIELDAQTQTIVDTIERISR